MNRLDPSITIFWLVHAPYDCNNREKNSGKWNRKQANRVALATGRHVSSRDCSAKSQSLQDGILSLSPHWIFPPAAAGIVNDIWLILK
jgi:hypothetical protein